MPFLPSGKYEPLGYGEQVQKKVKKPTMKITDNLTKTEIIQELDWRSACNTSIESEEISIIVDALLGKMKVNPSGYGEPNENDTEDRLCAIREALTFFTRRITEKHIYTNKSIWQALRYITEQVENNSTPNISTIDSFLQRQETTLFTLEDLNILTTKAYEEGYNSAVEDLKIIHKIQN